jgi:Protein of unknown function (DUF3071)
VQQLHLVGFTTDLEGLIFSVRKGSKSGGFVVPIDAALLATIEDARRMRDGDSGSSDSDSRSRGGAASGSGSDRRPRPESTLSPREIQARLRAGSSIAEVADAAGVDEDWVLRFAVPILAEQQQVVERVRGLVYTKARRGDSAQPLGTSVLWNLAERGLRMTEAAWDAAWRAWNMHGAVWVVQFAYVSRQRSQNAEWEVDLREGSLHARNRLAADLAYLEPGRRRRSQNLFEPADEVVAAVEPPASSASKSSKRALAGAGATSTAARATRPAKRAASPSSAGGNKATPKAKPSSTGKSAKAGKATKAAKAAKAAKGTSSKRTAKASKATAKRAAGKTAAVPPAEAATRGQPTVGDERVSHLARPMQPPERRGAARDGTPAEPSARRPVVGSAAAALTAPLAPPRAARPVAAPPPRPAPPERRPPPAAAPAPVARPRPAVAPADPVVAREAPVRARPVPPPDAPAPRPRPVPPRPAEAVEARPRPRPAAAAAPERAPERPRIERQRGRPEPTPEPAPERGRVRRPQQAGNGARPAADPPSEDKVWHGPGSGDPAPPVRIRADLAAAASANAEGARRTRRSAGRERPLRAR